MTSQGDGGDCNTFDGEKYWCYTEPDVCTDGERSAQFPDNDFSLDVVCYLQCANVLTAHRACSGNGRFVVDGGICECRCNPGFRGTTCEVLQPEPYFGRLVITIIKSMQPNAMAYQDCQKDDKDCKDEDKMVGDGYVTVCL